MIPPRTTSIIACLLSFALASPALRAEEKAAAVKPFNGENLEGWTTKQPKERSQWTVGVAKIDPEKPQELIVAPASEDGELVNARKGGVDIYTVEKYGDCTISLEFMVPKGSNSGVYVMGEYEVQILDSYGKEKVGPGDLGGLYGAAAPRTNAARAPGQWQTMVIVFQAPRFDGDKKTANAKFVKVTLNDQVVHENVEMGKPTPSGITGKEAPTGPLMFQGDHGPVAFRNIKIVPAK